MSDCKSSIFWLGIGFSDLELEFAYCCSLFSIAARCSRFFSFKWVSPMDSSWFKTSMLMFSEFFVVWFLISDVFCKNLPPSSGIFGAIRINGPWGAPDEKFSIFSSGRVRGPSDVSTCWFLESSVNWFGVESASSAGNEMLFLKTDDGGCEFFPSLFRMDFFFSCDAKRSEGRDCRVSWGLEAVDGCSLSSSEAEWSCSSDDGGGSNHSMCSGVNLLSSEAACWLRRLEDGRPYPWTSCRRGCAADAVDESVEDSFGGFKRFWYLFSYSSHSSDSGLEMLLIETAFSCFLFCHSIQPWHSTLLIEGASASASLCLAHILSSSVRKMCLPNLPFLLTFETVGDCFAFSLEFSPLGLDKASAT